MPGPPALWDIYLFAHYFLCVSKIIIFNINTSLPLNLSPEKTGDRFPVDSSSFFITFLGEDVLPVFLYPFLAWSTSRWNSFWCFLPEIQKELCKVRLRKGEPSVRALQRQSQRESGLKLWPELPTQMLFLVSSCIFFPESRRLLREYEIFLSNIQRHV